MDALKAKSPQIAETKANDPADVAEFIYKVLEMTANEQFEKIDWDFRKQEE